MKLILANRQNYGNLRSVTSIKYIVVHYTANTNDTAGSNANYFKNNVTGTSAHYFVDEKEVVQSVPDKNIAWAVGGNLYSDAASAGGGTFFKKCTNANSISVEMCNGLISFNESTIQNAADLINKLMIKYSIPIENVIRHFDVTGKACPKPFLEQNIWKNFKALIKEFDNMAEIEELKQRITALEEKSKVYNWTQACPDWSIPYVQKALDMGILRGDENGFLNLNDDKIWSLVIMLRKDGLMP